MKRLRMKIIFCVVMVLILCHELLNLTVSAKNNPLRVAFKNNMPYYQYVDENGNVAGMHVDIMNAIAKELKREIIYIPADNNRETLALLEEGKADLILGVPYYLEGEYNTTSEISSSEIVIYAPKSLWEEQKDPKVSKFNMVLEYGMINQMMINNIGARQYVTVNSQKAVLDIHLSGKAELMMCDQACMEYLLREKNLWEDYIIVHSQLDTTGYAIAVKKNDIFMRREIENALMAIRLSGEHEEICEQWIPMSEDSSILLKKILMIMTVVLVVIGGTLSVYVYVLYRIRRLLEKEVAEKTKALNSKVRQLSYESELRNRIIEHSPKGMILVDWDGRIKLINKSACYMAEITKTVVGTDIYEQHFYKRLLDLAGIHDQQTLLRGTGEQILILNDEINVERIYQIYILPTYNEERCNGALITIEDVTDKEEQRMAAAEKEKNQVMNRLIAGIAHEIKNPLTGIRNFAELIKTKRNDQRFLDYFAQLVPEEVDRISCLVESLMQYARPPKGNKDKIDISEVIKECAALMYPLLMMQERIVVETKMNDGLCIWADRDQMKQVFINLLMNGINAVERKMQNQENISSPAIEMTGEIIGDYIVVKVVDYGIGMTDEEVKKCTEPFFTTGDHGNGLGLATAKRFIQENDGMLWIESEKNVRTCMTIRFRRYEK